MLLLSNKTHQLKTIISAAILQMMKARYLEELGK
jgi:hypothetical protein